MLAFDARSQASLNDLRGPPGGPPRPPKPGGGAPGKPPGGNPGKPPGGGGPPTPAAGPPSPTGRPRPAGLLIPGPAARVAAAPAAPGPAVPSRAEGSAGGGPSTEQETTWVPRTIVRPRVRFSSASTCGAPEAPGAGFDFRLVRRNSSVSARTRFMCCKKETAGQFATPYYKARTGNGPYQKPASGRSSGDHR